MTPSKPPTQGEGPADCIIVAPCIVTTGSEGILGRQEGQPTGPLRRSGRKNKRCTAGSKRCRRYSADMETGKAETADASVLIGADEPKYCVCNREEFGTMIECDVCIFHCARMNCTYNL